MNNQVDKCRDCINYTINGCSLNRKPEDCGADMPLPLMMEVGFL